MQPSMDNTFEGTASDQNTDFKSKCSQRLPMSEVKRDDVLPALLVADDQRSRNEPEIAANKAQPTTLT